MGMIIIVERDNMERAIVTGAAGFTGSALVEKLIAADVETVAVVRPGSAHNSRLNNGLVNIVECDLKDYDSLHNRIDIDATNGVFFHLAWTDDQNTEDQTKNVEYTLNAVRSAALLGCRRIVIAGSQAEYGLLPQNDVISEEQLPRPNTAYGSAKVAACHLSRQLAAERGIEWVWGRMFSVIGKHEPRGRMFPELYHALILGRTIQLASCRQVWDYLDVYDSAEALIALAEKGAHGEIYNIANGNHRVLRDYVEEIRKIISEEFGQSGNVMYGVDSSSFISLMPSVEKINRDTGWSPKRSLADSIRDY